MMRVAPDRRKSVRCVELSPPHVREADYEVLRVVE